jgi:ABC-type multidrug transport system permease subunit
VHAKIFAVSFAACGLFLAAIISVLNGSDLFSSFKRGVGALVIFWIVGYFLGAILSRIVSEKQPASSKHREGT